MFYLFYTTETIVYLSPFYFFSFSDTYNTVLVLYCFICIHTHQPQSEYNHQKFIQYYLNNILHASNIFNYVIPSFLNQIIFENWFTLWLFDEQI